MSYRPSLAAFGALLLGSVLALSGCVKPMAADDGGAPPAIGGACAVSVAEDAYLGHADRYQLEARSYGDVCPGAPIALRLVSASGVEIWRFETNADVMFLSQDVQNRADMTEALAEWVAPPMVGMTRTNDLPRWRSGRDYPGKGDEEFPFYGAEGLSRGDYEALRKASLPMVCPVQGMESMVCVAIDDRTPGSAKAIEMGFQMFPG